MSSYWILVVTVSLIPAILTQFTLQRRCWRQNSKGVENCRRGPPKLYFNVTSGACEFTTNTRCRQGQFMFSTPWGCLRQCACHNPPVYGNCNSSVRRFYFNGIFQMCMPFEYSGCGGNHNNFGSFLECQFMCVGSDLGMGFVADA